MKQPLPYAQARVIADELLGMLAPVCHRIEVAGSLRRQRDTIGDLELVAIPRVEEAVNLFGDVVSKRVLLAEIISNPNDWRYGPLEINGPTHKQFTFQRFPVDLFLVNADTWGVQLAIRTGNAVFSHWAVSQRHMRGGLPDHLYIRDGRVHDRNTGFLLETPEEADILAVLGLPRDLPPDHPIRNASDWVNINRLAAGLRQEAAR